MLCFTALFTLCVFSYAMYSYRQESSLPSPSSSSLPVPLHCNESRCGVVVAECLRTQSCRCALQTADDACCRDCVRCLGAEHYADCCSCLECAKCPRRSSPGRPRPQSHVEEFVGAPQLFNALTAAQPHGSRVYSFELPPDEDALEAPTRQCTVLYLDVCVSWNKCRQRCSAYGASSYRWFHDGCCECVGAQCLDYGLNESRCDQCPEPIDESDEDDVDCGEAEIGECEGNAGE